MIIAQTPAEGILKHNDWGDSKVYRVTCECGSSDCDHNVWVEADDTGVNVTIYTTSRTNFWSKTRWYHIWTLLTKGYIDTQSTVCLKRQGALNYAETLKSAIVDVDTFRTERKEKSAVTKLAEQGDCA
jgi:hypothetical protein